MKRITPDDAAKLLGVPAQAIRVGLQKNRLPFGSAFMGNGRYTYLIYPGKLREYAGKEVYDEWIKHR